MLFIYVCLFRYLPLAVAAKAVLVSFSCGSVLMCPNIAVWHPLMLCVLKASVHFYECLRLLMRVFIFFVALNKVCSTKIEVT